MEGHAAPDVYFPLEITAREYAGSLLMAVELAERGFSAIVGHKSRVLKAMAHAPRTGVLFFKGGHDGGFRNSSGHLHVGLDPEAGIVYPDFADFFRRRKALSDLSTTTAQFCYGADDHRFLTQQFPELADRFHRVGTPRVQAWGPGGEPLYRDALRDIRGRYGRFILLVGSGGALHEDYRSPSDPVAAAGSWRSTRGDDASANDRLVQLAGRVSQELDITVVIRPHPVESWDTWLNIVRGRPRVSVEGAFDLSAWVRAAEAVVHSGKSTAAFEAAMVGTPSIGLLPSDARGDWVPESLSYGAHDLERAVELVSRAIGQELAPLPSREASELLDRKVDRPDVRPTERVAEVLEGLVDLSSGSAWGRSDVRQVRGRRRWRSPRSEHLGAVPPFKRWPLTVPRVRRDVHAVAEAWGLRRTPRVLGLGKDCALIRP
jgi:surface carbohydrate biosynthesis protein